VITVVPLAIHHRRELLPFFEKHPPRVSELTFTNLFVWRHHRPVWFAKSEESLFFLVESSPGSGPDTLFGHPLGPSAASISRLLPQLEGGERLPLKTAAFLGRAGFGVTADQDNADYVYRVRDLAELPGRRYAKKRNHVTRCFREHRIEYLAMTPMIIEECLSLQEQWCAMRRCEDDPGLEGENLAIQEALIHFQEFGLFGGVVMVDGSIGGFAVAERLTEDTAVCHFEKFLPHIPGLGQVVNQLFAKEALSGFTYVNREQDLGISGLRQAKESYFPFLMIPKYKAKRSPAP